MPAKKKEAKAEAAGSGRKPTEIRNCTRDALVGSTKIGVALAEDVVNHLPVELAERLGDALVGASE
jgi:hypothetical protein